MFLLLLAALVLGVAVVVGLDVGRRRRPLLGVLAAAGVLLAAAACYCVVMGLSLPM